MTAKEVLVLDSCTFIQEAGLTSRGVSALKHYLYHRGTQLVVPEVVAEECERHLAAIATRKIATIEETLTWLGRFCGRVNGWTAPGKGEVEERVKTLARADHLGAVVLPETNAVRARAETRNSAERPPSHRRPGLADCRIWEQCLELLANHDVVFVSADRDFRGHRNSEDLHPELWTEAAAVGAGRSLTFHSKMEFLLSELKREIPSIPKEEVFAFIYGAAAADIAELESNSGYRPQKVGDVTQTFLTTDQANVVEVRLEMDDEWEHQEDGKLADFQLSGSCHYHLADQQMRDLKVTNIRLLTTLPDGSVRAVEGSYTHVNLGILYLGGPAPIQPGPERLG